MDGGQEDRADGSYQCYCKQIGNNRKHSGGRIIGKGTGELTSTNLGFDIGSGANILILPLILGNHVFPIK